MPDFTIGGVSGAAFGGQTFGAQVVGKTLDYMNNMGSGGFTGGMQQMSQFADMASSMNQSQNQYGVQSQNQYGFGSGGFDKQTFGAAVVGKTLDYMNSNQFGGMGGSNADYDFQTSVLQSAFNPAGAIGGLLNTVG